MAKIIAQNKIQLAEAQEFASNNFMSDWRLSEIVNHRFGTEDISFSVFDGMVFQEKTKTKGIKGHGKKLNSASRAYDRYNYFGA